MQCQPTASQWMQCPEFRLSTRRSFVVSAACWLSLVKSEPAVHAEPLESAVSRPSAICGKMSAENDQKRVAPGAQVLHLELSGNVITSC